MVLDLSDILLSVSAKAPIKDEYIKNGKLQRSSNEELVRYVGGYAIVFPVIVRGKKYAFRCWRVINDSILERLRLISGRISAGDIRYFENLVYVEKGLYVNGQVYPTVRMKWVDGVNLKDYIVKNQNDEYALRLLAKRFGEMMLFLHNRNIAHGDLQHENIIVDSSGEIHLIDYDSLYLPEMSSLCFIDNVAGKPDYQHPNREDNKFSSRRLDYFSELVIITSILGVVSSPSLISKYKMKDSDSLLFRREDYNNLKSSSIYSDLKKLGGVFDVLLAILCKYLSISDINDLNPLEYELKNYGLTIADLIAKVQNEQKIKLCTAVGRPQSSTAEVGLKNSDRHQTSKRNVLLNKSHTLNLDNYKDLKFRK